MTPDNCGNGEVWWIVLETKTILVVFLFERLVVWMGIMPCQEGKKNENN